ncbi:hypothetical protein, partial [Amycolatopsis mediterranei]|uniref:hypothetical protein n=1 Tax=Amycolatopsis mediterranei TaxID=33910 RepID=UPI00332D9E92
MSDDALLGHGFSEVGVTVVDGSVVDGSVAGGSVAGGSVVEASVGEVSVGEASVGVSVAPVSSSFGAGFFGWSVGRPDGGTGLPPVGDSSGAPASSGAGASVDSVVIVMAGRDESSRGADAGCSDATNGEEARSSRGAGRSPAPPPTAATGTSPATGSPGTSFAATCCSPL